MVNNQFCLIGTCVSNFISEMKGNYPTQKLVIEVGNPFNDMCEYIELHIYKNNIKTIDFNVEMKGKQVIAFGHILGRKFQLTETKKETKIYYTFVVDDLKVISSGTVEVKTIASGNMLSDEDIPL